MDESLVDYAIERMGALGASYAEARMELAYFESYVVRNGNPDVADSSQAMGIGMRALVDGALSFASVDTLTKPMVKEQAERCVRLAKAAAKRAKKKLKFCDEKAHVEKYSVFQKERIADVPQEEKMGLLFDIEKAVPKDLVVPGRYLFLQLSQSNKYVANSDGSKIHSEIPRVFAMCVPTVVAYDRSAQAILYYAASAGWEWMKNEDVPGKFASEVRMLHKSLTEGKSPPKGNVDLIVGPEVTGIAAHESCGHPYEADRILGREAAQAGESFVKPNMLGERIGSKVPTIIEDPTLPNSYGFYLYDDEGVKAGPRILMKDGVINCFLHNRETAAKFKLERSNGSARSAAYNREPIVRMANTYVKPGDMKFEELLEGVKLGVYIKSFNEWNIDDTRYNQKYVGREAYLIENGEIKGPVGAPIIEITTPGFWSAVDAVGNDMQLAIGTCGKGEPAQGVPVGMGGPHMRLRGVRLGGG